MTASAFKVIIVGGGPVGLTAAHALTRAGIDFVLLERRETIVMDAGYNVILTPQGLRPLSQLNLLNELEKHSEKVLDVHRFDHSGHDMGSLYFFHYIREYFGIYPQTISRHDLTSVLYESLPLEARAKVLAKKKLTTIQSTPEGVKVLCEDGTFYSGGLVIGADGANSTVRQSMCALAMDSGSDQADEKPFLTTYRCLWIRFPTNSYPGLTASLVAETHGPGASTQIFVGRKMGAVGIYERLATPTTEHLRHTQADQDVLVGKWGFLPIARGGAYTVLQAYEQRLQAGMVSLEEGVMKQWSWGGRIVLVGDAAHKFTPSTGAGCNHGISDVVCLANALNRIILASSPDQPSTKQVAEALQTYQDQRYETVRAACAEAGELTSLTMWTTMMQWFIDRWAMFGFVQRVLGGPGSKMSRLFATSPVFDYIAAKERFSGSVPWRHAFPTEVTDI